MIRWERGVSGGRRGFITELHETESAFYPKG